MKKLLLTLTIITSLFLPHTASYATQTANEPTGYSIDDSFRPTNLPFNLNNASKDDNNKQLTPEDRTTFILNLVSGSLIKFAAPLAIIVIVLSGLQIVVGAGESEKIDAAKKTLTWAIMGLFAIILSYSIVRIVLNFITEI